jgi:hypothetical protein
VHGVGLAAASVRHDASLHAQRLKGADATTNIARRKAFRVPLPLRHAVVQGCRIRHLRYTGRCRNVVNGVGTRKLA